MNPNLIILHAILPVPISPGFLGINVIQRMLYPVIINQPDLEKHCLLQGHAV